MYILASRQNGTIYVGVTADIVRRVWQHRTGMNEGFTRRYAVKQLVWLELHPDMHSAIRREKQIKCWPRKDKIALIESRNPRWRDLFPEIVG